MAQLLHHQEPEFYGKELHGCRWSILQFFGFRRRLRSKKMLSDKKHGQGKGSGGSRRQGSYVPLKDEDSGVMDDEKNTEVTKKHKASKKNYGKASLRSLILRKLYGKEGQKEKMLPVAPKLLRTLSIHYLESNEYVLDGESSSNGDGSSHGTTLSMQNATSTNLHHAIFDTPDSCDTDTSSLLLLKRGDSHVKRKSHRSISMDGVLHKVPYGQKVSGDVIREELSRSASATYDRDGLKPYIGTAAKRPVNQGFRRSRSLTESLERYSHLLDSISSNESKRMLTSSKSTRDHSLDGPSVKTALQKTSNAEFRSKGLVRHAENLVIAEDALASHVPEKTVLDGNLKVAMDESSSNEVAGGSEIPALLEEYKNDKKCDVAVSTEAKSCTAPSPSEVVDISEEYAATCDDDQIHPSAEDDSCPALPPSEDANIAEEHATTFDDNQIQLSDVLKSIEGTFCEQETESPMSVLDVAFSDDPFDSNLEVADANFDTFIKWNIIQPVATSYNEVTKACKTQGIMHEFLSQKSISEKFIVSSRGPSLKKVRHLSVHDKACKKDMDLSRVRSLTVSGSAGDAISGFGKYKLMRVLDLEECSDVNDGHLKDICKLWNLRYLSLGARITTLPKEIAKLKLLETLHLSKTTVNELPVEVIGLPCLIHLIGKFKLPDQEPVSSKLEQLSTGSNLETLAGYVASDQSQVFPQLMVHMKKLRKVKIWCEFTGGSGSNSIDHLSRAIRKYMTANKDYGDVRSLSIDFQKCSEQLQNFLHSLEVEASCYLSSLKLHGKLPTLPPFVALAEGLIQLCLSSTTLTRDVLSAVSNLKNLLYLKLIADHLDNFVIRVGAIQSLRRLRFVVRGPNPILPEIQNGALPKLVSLQLICEHLAGLSDIEIRHLTSLKEVTLDSRVTTETRGAWEAAARNHPKRPNVLLFEMVDDPTGNEPTENPVAAPEEAAPDQTAMQGQIAEEGSESSRCSRGSSA